MDSAWVDGLTIDQVLTETVSRYGDRDAIEFPQLGLKQSWEEFNESVEQVACALQAMGVKKGEHVAVWATNVPEWLYLQFGSARIGARA